MTANLSTAAPHRLTPKIPYSIINYQYADDTIIFASARGNTLRILMLAIHCFTAASGLKVNYEKSQFVPLSIDQAHLMAIEILLNCKRCALPITYLGMPLTLNTPTRQDYLPLLNKIEKRLQGWQARFISRAGRLQLIKSVLLTIPTYFMACFKLPTWLVAKIELMARRFLWASNRTDHPIHLINWQVVCIPQNCNGMGVINIRLQNMALLVRWLWRLYEPQHKLWANYAAMIHAVRPNPDGPLILSKSGSFFWKSICKLLPLFYSCTAFQVANGKRVSFWFHPWAGQPLINDAMTRPPFRYISLYHAKQRGQTLFPAPLTLQHHQASTSLSQFNPQSGTDTLIWKLSASGTYSVNSLYKILSQGGRCYSDIVFIWKAKVTPSMRFFFFLLLNDRTLTHDVMTRRNINHTPGCVMCDRQHVENAMHLFFSCSYAQRVWAALNAATGKSLISVKDSVKDTFLCSRTRNQGNYWDTLFITVLWEIWRERNHRTFREEKMPSFVLVNRILQEAQLYTSNC